MKNNGLQPEQWKLTPEILIVNESVKIQKEEVDVDGIKRWFQRRFVTKPFPRLVHHVELYIKIQDWSAKILKEGKIIKNRDKAHFSNLRQLITEEATHYIRLLVE